jgi:DNA-binding CsgD family transcriptional regulator
MQKRFGLLILILLFGLSGFGQYKISGYINSDEKNKTVYLSLLQYNEEVAIYPEQILVSAKTDSTGYFEICGKLLPRENMFYRIHSNRENKTVGYEFIETGPNINYHNFIFSNADSIYFPPGNKTWFDNPQNTNKADAQWRKSLKYELKLTKEFSETKNADAILQAETNFFNAYKQYCNDSLSDVLVKLLAYSHIKRNISFINDDYKKDTKFYNKLLDELNEYYSGTSYYSQFREEISKLSISIYKQKMIVYKRLSFAFGILTLLLVVVVLLQYILIKKEKAKTKTWITKGPILTRQEKKIATLMCGAKSNKEIADQLFISLSTVKTHIGNIYSKLNVSSRQELMQKLQNHTRD